ncbi:hypothetical protein, partial [Micromonospora carbonacea]|uniref:hypothetical protein n=1 Tax=Micromonospora carbonacea TaxID=47853 RepID=UPI0033EF4D26
MTHPGFVLFDLDGTLIRPGAPVQRLHMATMAAAIADVCGVAEEFQLCAAVPILREHAEAGLWTDLLDEALDDLAA